MDEATTSSSSPSRVEIPPIINPHGILLHFRALLEGNFIEVPKVEHSTQLECLHAEKLLQCLLENLQELVLQPDEEMILTDMAEELVETDEYLDEHEEGENETDPFDQSTNYEEEPKITSPKRFISMERKKEIVALANANLNWSWNTLKRHGAKEITSPDQLRIIKEQVKANLNHADVYKQIDAYVFGKIQEARLSFKIIRSSHLRRWAFQKYIQITEISKSTNIVKFKASKMWLARFKARHKLSSRKINRLVSTREVKSDEEIIQSARKFQTDIKSISSKFDQDQIFNTDQCGFNYEMMSARTITHKGEKIVKGFALSPTNLVTHSYTVQYLIAMSGEIKGPVFICLREPNGKLGPHVKRDLEAWLPSNVNITCSRSGKLSTSLNEHYIKEILVPAVNKNFLHIVDSWPGHTKLESYTNFFGEENGLPEITLKVIPPKCTPIVQPLDTTFHRQLKYLAREILSHLYTYVDNEGNFLADSWTNRHGVIKLQSILHFLISAPLFKPMVKYSWYSSGLTDEREDFVNVKEGCFTFTDKEPIKCQMKKCSKTRIIKCSYCMKVLCIHHLWVDNHSYKCEVFKLVK